MGERGAWARAGGGAKECGRRQRGGRGAVKMKDGEGRRAGEKRTVGRRAEAGPGLSCVRMKYCRRASGCGEFYIIHEGCPSSARAAVHTVRRTPFLFLLVLPVAPWLQPPPVSCPSAASRGRRQTRPDSQALSLRICRAQGRRQKSSQEHQLKRTASVMIKIPLGPSPAVADSL